MEVIYKNMREELREHLFALSSIDYQRQVWVMGLPFEQVQHDEFDYAVHFLFDDTLLARDPLLTIGKILKTPMEAEAIARVVASLEKIFQEYGTDLTDAEYIELLEWDAVIKAAGDALVLLKD